MKYLIDVPDEIVKATIEQDASSRRILQDELGITEYAAKINSYIIKKGKPIWYTSPPLAESGKTIKTLCLFDTHFPYHNQANVDIAIDYGLKNGCSELLIGGDGVDFYQVSMWYKNPSNVPYYVEINKAKESLKEISNPFETKYYIPGNHEKRLMVYIFKSAPALHNLEIEGAGQINTPNVLHLDSMGYQYFDNEAALQAGLKPFKLGKLYVMHGNEIRVTYTAVNPAKLYYEKAGVPIMVGHIHRVSERIKRKINGEYEGAWTVGMLGDMNPDYQPANDWTAGFAIVERDSEGYFSVGNKKIIDGKVL